MNAPRPLPPCDRALGPHRWTEQRERLDAEWSPLRDEKHRLVHGHAIITETPVEMCGRDLADGSYKLRIHAPFGVSIVATRDGAAFGAIPRSTGHLTRELALEHARSALVQQGKRYARKYGRTTGGTP